MVLVLSIAAVFVEMVMVDTWELSKFCSNFHPYSTCSKTEDIKSLWGCGQLLLDHFPCASVISLGLVSMGRRRLILWERRRRRRSIGLAPSVVLVMMIFFFVITFRMRGALRWSFVVWILSLEPLKEVCSQNGSLRAQSCRNLRGVVNMKQQL